MSAPFAAVPLAVLADRRLSLEQIRVLIALLSFTSKDSAMVFPSRQAISELTGMHLANISSATSALERLGWLSKDGKGGFSKATRYTITVPETVAQSATVVEQATVAQSATKTVAEQATGRVADSARGMRVAESARGKEHTIEHTNRTHTHRSCSPSASELAEDGFAEFWSAYPKKVGKAVAEKAWKKLKPTGQLLADLMTGLQRQKGSTDWQKDAGQFIPHPATWLNGRRWEDEPAGNATRQPATHDKRPQPGESRLRFGATEVFTETAGWVPA